MGRNKYDGLIEEWKVDLVRSRAKKWGFLEDDVPDLEQQAALELLKVQFKPDEYAGVQEKTLVVEVIDRMLKMVMRNRKRDVRRVNYLAELIESAEGLVTEKSVLGKLGTTRTEMRLDVERALMGLSEEERTIIGRLGEGDSQAEIARSMGSSKAKVNETVMRLREKFRRWGIDLEE